MGCHRVKCLFTIPVLPLGLQHQFRIDMDWANVSLLPRFNISFWKNALLTQILDLPIGTAKLPQL